MFFSLSKWTASAVYTPDQTLQVDWNRSQIFPKPVAGWTRGMLEQ